jgi:hypothetical protein
LSRGSVGIEKLKEDGDCDAFLDQPHFEYDVQREHSEQSIEMIHLAVLTLMREVGEVDYKVVHTILQLEQKKFVRTATDRASDRNKLPFVFLAIALLIFC